MQNAVVSGAAGFLGYHVTEQLIKKGYYVYALVRKGSAHNERLLNLEHDCIKIVEYDYENIRKLPDLIDKKCTFIFHLAWGGERNNIYQQYANIMPTLQMIEVAKEIGCKRIVCVGSQAEYGAVKKDILLEDRLPNPCTAYGAAKVAACTLTKSYAFELGIEWVWGRIFSVYGRYEPSMRMLPYIYNELKQGNDVKLSSCQQNWDYLYATDAADGLIILGEQGKNGEIYNVANGDYRPLYQYVEELKDYLSTIGEVKYGDDPYPFISLQPSIKKIKKDTGWAPKVKFRDGLELLGDYFYGEE